MHRFHTGAAFGFEVAPQALHVKALLSALQVRWRTDVKRRVGRLRRVVAQRRVGREPQPVVTELEHVITARRFGAAHARHQQLPLEPPLAAAQLERQRRRRVTEQAR
jgi:hypothetical protein